MIAPNPVALVTGLGPEARDPNGGFRVRFCASCFAFHPADRFHRDRSRKGGYRYACSMCRRGERPSTAKPCPKCGGELGRGAGRWHRCASEVRP